MTAETAPLAEIIESSVAGHWGTDPGSSDMDVSVIRNGDIADTGDIRWNALPTRSLSTKQADGARVRADDLLITTSGYCGQVAHVCSEPDVETCATNFVRRLRVDRERVVPRYLFHFMNRSAFQRALAPYVRGTTMKNLSLPQAMPAVHVPLPSLDEQAQIAGLLDAADTLRAKRRRSLALLDSLCEAIFFDLFGDPVANDRGWDESDRLGEVADVGSGITKGRKLRGQATRSVPYLAVANVQAGYLRLDAVKTIEATDVEIERYRLQAGDILLTEGGDPDKLGRGTLWAGEITECIHQNHVFRVRVHDGRFVPEYVSWLLGSVRGRRYFLRSAKQTTGIASINKSQLAAFPLLRPPRELQERFVDALGAQRRSVAGLASHGSQLDALFASLQHRAFTGQL